MHPNESLVGKTIGNYEILRELGRGGMGIVYKAHEQSLQRVVALKVLPTQLAQDSVFVKRFVREARASARLNHPNIVTVHAVSQHEGHYFIAMEYVKGQSLSQLIRAEGQLDVNNALDIGAQAADALSEAHKANLIHRDIKPHNIMIDQTGRVKVMDFGLAKAMSEKTGLTGDGTKLGTPRYMSPEQVRGDVLDGRSDLFSLGATLYEMLAGCPPYEADTPMAVMYQITHEAFPDVRNMNSEVPRPVVELLGAMTAKEPNDRPESADTVSKALRAILDHQAIPPLRPKPIGESDPELVASQADTSTIAVPKPVTRAARPWVIALAFILVFLVILVFRTFSPLSPGRVFADPILEAAVQEALGKPGGPILEGDLSLLAELAAPSRKIARLDGLERCENLQVLKLGLGDDPGEESRNRVVDLRPLNALTNLRHLDLTGNRVADIRPLASLRQLEALYISFNPVTDIAPLAGLTNMKELDLLVRIDDVSPLASLTQLNMLNLEGNSISDIASLAGLTQLNSLWLRNNQIESIAAVAGFKRLTLVDLEGNRVTELSPLAGLTQLRALSFAGLDIQDDQLLNVRNLPQVESLWLQDCTRISDAGMVHVAELGSLVRLSLGGCAQITDEGLGSLVALTKLRTLNVWGTRVTDEGVSALQRALPECRIFQVRNIDDVFHESVEQTLKHYDNG